MRTHGIVDDDGAAVVAVVVAAVVCVCAAWTGLPSVRPGDHNVCTIVLYFLFVLVYV